MTLLERQGGRFVLTEAGEVLYSYAQRIFRLMDEADERLARLKDAHRETLRIATTKTIATYYLPAILRAMKRLHQGARIRLSLESNQDAVDHVLAGQSDVGVVVATAVPKDLISRTIFSNELVVVVPSTPAWRKRASVSIEELKDEPLILREMGSKTREIADALLRAHGVDLSLTTELADVESIKSAVKAGLGISILPKISIETELVDRSLRCLRIAEGNPSMDFCVVFRRGQELAPIVRDFLAALAPPGQSRSLLADGGKLRTARAK